MFATEELTLKYFLERGEPLSLYDLMDRFDNTTYEEAFEIVKVLEKENRIVWAGSTRWIITDIGKDYLEDLRNRKKVTKPPTNAQKTVRDILIGLFVTIVGGLILWLLTGKSCNQSDNQQKYKEPIPQMQQIPKTN